MHDHKRIKKEVDQVRKIKQLAISGLLFIFLLSGCGHMKLTEKVEPGCVTLYEHINFKGKKKKICQSNPNISFDFNDITSSIKADCSVRSFTLYQHINFEGNMLTIKGCNEISDIRHINPAFHDITSSITIEHANDVK